MPRVIELADEAAIGLGECADALAAQGFDPADEGSLLGAARLLRRLGNDADFLGDVLVEQLAARHSDEGVHGYGAQSIVLSPLAGGCFLRANLWPSVDEALHGSRGSAAWLYGMPHDHNFDFLTLGYFGPGYESDYWEYDYAGVQGWTGEAVDLSWMGRHRLEPGRIVHYRAHRDVHRQFEPAALSVSLNVMHAAPGLGWRDQYRFDVEAGTVAGIVNPGASEAFLRVAVALGGGEALDLAHRFARAHPSDRMRLAAWDALAARETDCGTRDALWAQAEIAGSLLVAREASERRRALAA